MSQHLFCCYAFVMNNLDRTERDIAFRLISSATEYVEAYVDNEQDWDAGVVAVLARALELASGRKMKDLKDVFIWL